MTQYIKADAEISDELLKLIAHIPTKSLARVIDTALFRRFEDTHYMRVAYYLAEKGYEEGGCPIGGVVKDNETGAIVGKGHNTLVQEDHPYNHGETSAIRDAGRINFGKTTMFTTLSPCDVCATLIYMRGFPRVVVGDVTSASGNEEMLREKGVQVDIGEDQSCIDLYGKYRSEKPELDIEDWKGLAAVS
jgi:creatinine deaminase